MHEEIKSITDGLTGSVDKLNKLVSNKMGQLDAEAYKKIAPFHADLNKAVRAAKNGNIEELNKLNAKHANFNRPK